MNTIPYHTIIADDLFLESEIDAHPELSDRTVAVGQYMTGELIFRCLDNADKQILLNDVERVGTTKIVHMFFHADGTRRRD